MGPTGAIKLGGYTEWQQVTQAVKEKKAGNEKKKYGTEDEY